MQHFYDFCSGMQFLSMLQKLKFKRKKIGEAIYASFVSDKIRLWFRVGLTEIVNNLINASR